MEEAGCSVPSDSDGISDLLELLSGDVLEDGSDERFPGEIETSSKFELDECGIMPLDAFGLEESGAKRIKLDPEAEAEGVLVPTSSTSSVEEFGGAGDTFLNTPGLTLLYINMCDGTGLCCNLHHFAHHIHLRSWKEIFFRCL